MSILLQLGIRSPGFLAHILDILTDICPQAEEWELMRELSYLDVSADVLWRRFETLSNGEQTKVLLAALFTIHVPQDAFAELFGKNPIKSGT